MSSRQKVATNLVRITWDTGNSRQTKIEGFNGIVGLAHERKQKSTEATVHMNWYTIFTAELQKRWQESKQLEVEYY